MTGARKRSPKEAYRPPRGRKEILVAIAAVAGVLVVTAVLIFVLRPRDDTPSAPPSIPIETPVSVPDALPPEASLPPVPPDSSAPPESVVPVPSSSSP